MRDAATIATELERDAQAGFSPSNCSMIDACDLYGENTSYSIRAGFDEGREYRRWHRNVFSIWCVACHGQFRRNGSFTACGQRVQRWRCKGCGVSVSRPIPVRNETCYAMRKPRGRRAVLSAPKDKQARYRHKMRSLGRCPRCGAKADGFELCEAHRWYQRKRKRRKMVIRPRPVCRDSSNSVLGDPCKE